MKTKETGHQSNVRHSDEMNDLLQSWQTYDPVGDLIAKGPLGEFVASLVETHRQLTNAIEQGKKIRASRRKQLGEMGTLFRKAVGNLRILLPESESIASAKTLLSRLLGRYKSKKNASDVATEPEQGTVTPVESGSVRHMTFNVRLGAAEDILEMLANEPAYIVSEEDQSVDSLRSRVETLRHTHLELVRHEDLIAHLRSNRLRMLYKGDDCLRVRVAKIKIYVLNKFGRQSAEYKAMTNLGFRFRR